MTAEPTVLADVDSVADLLTGGQQLDADQTRFVLDALEAATDDALGAVAGRVECHTARGGTVEPQLAALRAQARNREAKAAIALLAARAAEGAGDSAAAGTLIDEALSLRPGLEPALHDAAQYAATRGDYPTADRYLRRAERPSPLRPGVTQALSVSPDSVPRNDSCPCGSGRKFKVCCLRETAPPLAARTQLLYALLGTYAERAPGVELLAPLLERTADADRCAMFLLDLALFRGGLVERFLAARGPWLRPDELELIESWRQLPVTLYEAVEVKRGTAVTLRPLPDGEPVVLSDPLFAQSADRLELFCGRILHDDVGPRLLTQPVHIPRYRRRALLDLLASNPSNEQLAGFLAPEPPVRLRNSDGDELHECRVTYRVPNAAATFELLAERLVRIGAQVLTRHHPLPDGRAMSLGQLTHERDDFILTANSPARLAEIEAILREAAPDAVERDRHSKRLSPDPAPDARIAVLESYFLLDPAAPAVDSEQLARHTEAGWLDTPGVVGELTPRQAAASPDPAVRAELSAMIDDVEAIRLQSWRAGRPTAGLMNPQRLRDALSITPAD